MRADEIENFEQLREYAESYGYRRTIGGHIRQESWQGVSFSPDGTVRYMRTGAVIATNVSYEGMAILINIIGRKDK